jgi:Raf kinase inhibitor-like YbhB/YbcL family protein
MLGYVVAAVALTLASNTFTDGGTLPKSAEYNAMGCAGSNTPPELHWAGAPAGAKSFALTVYDPDAAPPVGWWHWVVFNIPATDTSLNANAKGGGGMPGVAGTNGFKSRGYGGPCPPPGKPHHYNFTIYALDVATVPGATGDTTGPELLKAIEGHVLAKATLTGLYGR